MSEKLLYLKRTVATTVALALLGMYSPYSTEADTSGYYVAPYNNGPLEATIQYHIEQGNLSDEYCGDPTITGYAGLHEAALNIPHGTTVGKIVYLKETHQNSDRQEHKLCVMDVVAPHHVHVRPDNQIADVDWNTFNQINPNQELEITFVPPEVTELTRPLPASPNGPALDSVSPDLSP